MLDKIQSYFGLTTMPFGRALAPGMLFPSGDHAQAAARIGVPVGTVKSRLHYALHALRLVFEEMGVVT